MINTITQEQRLAWKSKFDNFDFEKNIADIYADPSLFGFSFFKEENGKPLKLFDYQDLIVNDKSKKKVVCIARQSGKTTMAAVLALHKAFFTKQCTVVVISKGLDQSIEFIKRIKTLLLTANHPELWKGVLKGNRESKSQIEIKNHNAKTYSRIISLPATDTARGYTAHLVIVDEAAFIENGDYIFNQVIEPMTNYTNGDILLISTPNGQQGYFYNCFNSEYWNSYQFDWTFCPVNTEEKMKEKRQRMTALEFGSEYEAKFMAPLAAYFDHGEISRSVKDVVPSPTGVQKIVLGVDLGKVNDHTVIHTGFLKGEDEGEGVVVLWQRVEFPLGTSYAVIFEKIKELYNLYSASLVLVDSTSGEGMSDHLLAEGINVEPVKFSMQKKIDMASNLKILMEQGRLIIPNTKKLVEQLQLFEYEYTSSNNLTLHHPVGGHDDEVDALMLLAWGLVRKGITPGFSFLSFEKKVSDAKLEDGSLVPDWNNELSDDDEEAIEEANRLRMGCFPNW